MMVNSSPTRGAGIQCQPALKFDAKILHENENKTNKEKEQSTKIEKKRVIDREIVKKADR